MSVDMTKRGRGISRASTIDQQLPDRRRGQAQKRQQPDHLEQALAALKLAARAHPKLQNLDYRIDRDLEVIVVLIRDGRSQRVLREIALEEAQRLTQLLKAGRQHLLDRTL